MRVLSTRRLGLIPLSTQQLRLFLENPEQLEADLGLPVSRAIVTDRLQRAIKMKLVKMTGVEEDRIFWYTYWLLVIRGIPFGAGLAGFKGFPDEHGEVEIGYGIDPLHQNQGYMTEAVEELIGWALEEERCQSIVARDVDKANTASQRVLTRLGMTVYEETASGLSYRIVRT